MAAAEASHESGERVEIPVDIVNKLLRTLSSPGRRSYYIPQIDATLGSIIYPHEDVPHKLRRVTAAIRAACRAINLKIKQACDRGAANSSTGKWSVPSSATTSSSWPAKETWSVEGRRISWA